MTQEQVANKIGIGPQAVHKWETGKTPVDLETLRLLAETYQTTPDALLFDPNDSQLAARIRTAVEVLKTLPSEAADQWLGVGVAMSGTGKPKP